MQLLEDFIDVYRGKVLVGADGGTAGEQADCKASEGGAGGGEET
jgi:hypothetical protein